MCCAQGAVAAAQCVQRSFEERHGGRQREQQRAGRAVGPREDAAAACAGIVRGCRRRWCGCSCAGQRPQAALPAGRLAAASSVLSSFMWHFSSSAAYTELYSLCAGDSCSQGRQQTAVHPPARRCRFALPCARAPSQLPTSHPVPSAARVRLLEKEALLLKRQLLLQVRSPPRAVRRRAAFSPARAGRQHWVMLTQQVFLSFHVNHQVSSTSCTHSQAAHHMTRAPGHRGITSLIVHSSLRATSGLMLTATLPEFAGCSGSISMSALLSRRCCLSTDPGRGISGQYTLYTSDALCKRP